MKFPLYPFLGKALGSAALLFGLVLCVHVAAVCGGEDPGSSDESRPAAVLPVGTEVVLTAPEIRLVEREESLRDHKVGEPKRLVPGFDRLIYRIARYPGCDLRLMSPLKSASDMPARVRDRIIVAEVDHVLHFRTFDGEGKVKVEADERKLAGQARQIEDLKNQLVGLWPPHELTRAEQARLIAAVASIVGHMPGKEIAQLCSLDDFRMGWVLPTQVIPAETAIAYFTEQIAKEPRNVGAYWMRGRVWLHQKQRDRAKVDLDRAIEIEPKRAGLYVTRGMILTQMQQIDPALADCNRAIELDRDDGWAFVVRANLWLAKRDYPRALADLDEVIRLDKASRLGWSERFRYWLHVKDRDFAGHDKNEGVVLDPGSTITHLWRGDVWLADREADRAIAEYTTAIGLEPANAFVYSRRAMAWARKAHRDKEAADLTTAIELDPQQTSYRVARAQCWSAEGRHKNAIADFDFALRMEPENPSIWVSRGNEWRKNLKLDEALADYSRAIQLDPRHAPAYVARGNVWKQRRVFDRAIQEFSYLIQIDPTNALAHQALARILATCHEANFRNGRLALDEANRACELTRWQDPDCLDTLATACAEVGDFAAALKWENQAIKVLGQDTSPLRKSMDVAGRKGVQFEDRLNFYKSKKPVRE